MEKIRQALQEIMEINAAYELSNEAIQKTLDEMETAKVCTPIIGKFSSGKSAMANALLGYTRARKLLKEDITPETAVPTEIVYQEGIETGVIYWNDGREEPIEVGDYRERELAADKVRAVRLKLKNSTLEAFPDVMLVDMPGFESGCEIHNRAIDGYLPQSLAYIITFAADDMTVRESIGTILKELCLHNMPLCVVITKCDKKNEGFEESLEHLKQSLKRYIGNQSVTYCQTSSRDGNVEELKRFLVGIQHQSQGILADHFRQNLSAVLETTESYLDLSLKKRDLSESELEEEEERLEKQFQRIDADYQKERETFEEEVEDCTEEIVADVEAALRADEGTLISMAMSQRDIKDRINSVVRNTITTSSERRLRPKVEKYQKRVARCIRGEDIGEIPVSGVFSLGTEDVSNGNSGMQGSNFVFPVLAAVAGALLQLPPLAIIGAGLLAFFGLGNKGGQKQEDAREQVRSKLQGEVFPQVMQEVERNVKRAAGEWLEQVNTAIAEEVENKKMTLEKALADLKARISDEAAEREALGASLERDLERIGEIRNDL